MTAVELLPVHQHVPEAFLLERGLTNYWGYNTIGFFAPHDGYSAAVRAGHRGGQVAEFQAMVAALHAAGLEVVLDVVFNHTAEGGQLGPTLCHRGLDNPAYYRLDPGDPRRYVDTTGTGNAVNAGDPVCLQMIMDSLRYWLTEMGVDGFRFDLAPTLAREDGGFDRMSAFFDLVAQDPVVSRAKLIAEPWDVGQPDSYDVGRFPPLWSEWNGRYRDSMRDFWRRRGGLVGEFATRFSGSSDLYGGSRRRPTASVNLVTVHDGFTFRDLVSYDTKHNQANGEANRDGPMTAAPGTAGWKAPPRTPRWSEPAPASPGASPPCWCRSGAAAARRGSSSAAPRAATTTPTARTTRSPGWTGPSPTRTRRPSPGGWWRCGAPTRSSADGFLVRDRRPSAWHPRPARR